MKSSVSVVISLLINMVAFAQEQPDFKLLDNIAVNQSVYSVYVKSESKKFTLKLCEKDTCVTTLEYTKSIQEDLLTSDVLKTIKNHFDNGIDSTTVTESQKKAIAQLKNKIEAFDFDAIKASKTELENALYGPDNEKDQYSARIILNTTVPYKLTYKVLGNHRPTKTGDSIGIQNQNTETKIRDKKLKDTTVIGTGTLKIIDAKIQFFNNKASSIYVKAELTDHKVTEKLIFVNNSYSVAIRYFNRYGSTVSAETKNRSEVTIDYNDVFDYESDQFFNYSIANNQVSLATEPIEKQSAKVIQRRFFDFFTAIINTDVMGFNTDNSNSILNAQAKLLLPLNLRNWKKLTLTRQFVTTANIALNNSFEDESRFIAIADDERFSNFDLLRKQNLSGKVQLDFLTYESKGWFLNTSIGYGAGFYRTGFRYTQTEVTDTDIVTNRQLLSVGHGPYLNFEIRPQSNFGADIFISLEDLNYNDTRIINNRSFKNDIIVDGGNNNFLVKYNLVNVEANFYWLTSPEKSKKGGIYSKLGCYYHTENHSVFPQIMVGYATNLTSFVNRFKAKSVPTESD